MVSPGETPVTPSWRDLSPNEELAISCFWRTTPDDPPLRLRSSILELHDRMAPTLSATDLMWLAVGVAGFTYGRHVVPARHLGREHCSALLRIGIAGIAGNVPELLTDHGFDAHRLSLHGYLTIRPWRKLDLSKIPHEVIAAWGKEHEEIAPHVASEMDRAANAFVDWQRGTKAAPKGPGSVEKLHCAVFSTLGGAISNRASPEAARASVFAEVRRRGRRDLCQDVADADDILAAFWTHDWDGSESERPLGVFPGKDGLWHIDAITMVDVAELGPGRVRPKEVVASQKRDRDGEVKTQATRPDDDPAAIVAKREYEGAAVELLKTGARDVRDHQIIELFLEGVESCSELARRLGKGESFVRARYAQMAERARRAAPPGMKDHLNGYIGP
jgi:hypothetical protein